MPNSVAIANPAYLTPFLTEELPLVYISRSGFFKGQLSRVGQHNFSINISSPECSEFPSASGRRDAGFRL
jgi:hypothetical protein